MASWNVFQMNKPPPRFQPLPIDDVGLPNVVYGCGDTARQIDEIQIHVIGWGRHESMETLLRQLKDADYDGWHKDVSLFVHLDGGSPEHEEVSNVAMRFKWTHGPQYIKKQKENIGLRRMWLDSLGQVAREAGNNTLLVVFEDDTRVSLEYFQWLLALIDTYGRNHRCRDSNLVGFSLSPLLLQEMALPFKRWDAREAMGERNNNDHRHLVYLSAVPSSWGAAYWSDQWKEFDKFVRLRMQPPFYDIEAENVKHTDYSELKLSPEELHIPGARSNVWPKSWKRFMVDFMYGRGLVMMYPNLPGQQGLATALQESGEHIGEKRSLAAIRNPRVADLLDHLDLQVMGNLPRYGDLAVFGLSLLPTTREQLVDEGATFLQGILQKCISCKTLVQVWARPGFEITLNVQDKPPPICVADLYTSVSTAASRPLVSTSTATTQEVEKFLLFEPQYGANNQLHAVVEAYYWARALGRRLILPPVMMPRVSAFELEDPNAKWLDLEKFFHVSDANKSNLFASSKATPPFDHPALEPIGFTKFLTLNKKPWRLLRVTRNAVFDRQSLVLTASLHKSDIELINLRHLFEKAAVPVEKLQHYLGGCSDEVLAFDGLFFANLLGINPRELMPDVMLLSEEAAGLYQRVKDKFVSELGTSEYACYHVRLGDFASMCHTLEYPDQSPEIASTFPASYLQTAQEFSCSVSPHELSLEIIKNGYPSLIMSDNPLELQETLSTIPLPTLTSDWVSQVVKESLEHDTTNSELQLFSLLVDQQLCADAKLAVLNRFSTVSQRVLSLRRGEDYEFWRRRDT